ncbi:hypothetical protein [Nonlabens sp.]|uniref:hypothetical protein n=1 Tax=Nonlabens sp. TaxID=1888209 RepID=UPI003265FDD7
MKNIIYYNLGLLAIALILTICSPMLGLLSMIAYGPLQVLMSFLIMCYTENTQSRLHSGIHVILSVIILILFYSNISSGNELIIQSSIVVSIGLFLYSFVVHYLSYKNALTHE